MRLVLIVSCQLCAISAVAQSKYSAVALSGQRVPGTNGGAVFYTFYGPAISGSGAVTFQAQVTGIDSFGPYGIWAGKTSASLALVARQNTPAPGSAGVTYYSFTDPTIGAQDKITYFATLDPAVNGGDQGIWFGSASSPALLAMEGTAAPGTAAGVVFDRFSLPVVTGSSDAFIGYLRGTGISFGTNDAGIWSGSPGAVTLLARQGATAPGAGTGVTYSGFSTLLGNTVGGLAFGATLSSSTGIYSGTPSAVAPVALSGNSVPGITGVRYFTFSNPALAQNVNNIAFSSRLTGTGVVTANGTAMWSGSFGAVSLVARAGSQAPGLSAGVNFGSFLVNTTSSAPVIADNGAVAFQVALTGTGVTSANDSSIWAGLPGSLHLVAREGSQAQGTPSGITFDTLSQPSINPLGEVAFVAPLAGPGVDYTNNSGLWATDLSGNLQLLARNGDLFDVGSGDMRTLAGLSIGGGSFGTDGRQSVFNATGQLAFRASFTDGSSGVFVTTIPEPSSIWLIASGLGAFLSRRLRRPRKQGVPS